MVEDTYLGVPVRVLIHVFQVIKLQFSQVFFFGQNMKYLCASEGSFIWFGCFPIFRYLFILTCCDFY